MACNEKTWEKKNGRYVCQAEHCPHWRKGGGCELGKVSLTCDNADCKWNLDRYKLNVRGRCGCMDVHLDADGKCLGYEK